MWFCYEGLYEYYRIMPYYNYYWIITYLLSLSGHSMVSDFMLSSFLLLMFHMKKKLYHVTSVLCKLDHCGLVLVLLFCFKRRVCILQDYDVTLLFLSLGGRKHV